jgi:hypothetical protein
VIAPLELLGLIISMSSHQQFRRLCSFQSFSRQSENVDVGPPMFAIPPRSVAHFVTLDLVVISRSGPCFGTKHGCNDQTRFGDIRVKEVEDHQ